MLIDRTGKDGKSHPMRLLTPDIGVLSIVPDIDVYRTRMSAIMTKDASIRGNEGLKALREKAGLNRKQMAKAVGVTTRMWQRYEKRGANA